MPSDPESRAPQPAAPGAPADADADADAREKEKEQEEEEKAIDDDDDDDEAVAENRIEQLNKLRQPRDTRLPAQPPGTLRYFGDHPHSGTRFRVIDYDRESFRELECESVAECDRFECSASPSWIQVIGLSDTRKLGELLGTYGVHPLVQEDIANTRHNPKTEDLGSYLFVTAREISFDPRTDHTEVRHFALLILPNVVITFHEEVPRLFEPVVARIRTSTGRLRKRGVDYLAWAILDALLDHYLVVLDEMEAEANRLDDQLIRDARKVEIGDIHSFKQEAVYLCRLIRPMREVIGKLRSSTNKLITKNSRPYFGDLFDHAVHAVEGAEHLRETAGGLRDFHMAVLSNRMNEVMKVLTSISTVFLPLTFIAGVYGMNFEFMPELQHPWAYPALWGVFVLVTVGMISYFRRRGWL